jgi:hypothetical protein
MQGDRFWPYRRRTDVRRGMNGTDNAADNNKVRSKKGV